MQKQAFFAYKTLVLLKKRSKSTFLPMKVCRKWVCLEVSWVDFVCFMHFYKGYMAFEPSFFRHYRHFSLLLDHSRVYLGHSTSLSFECPARPFLVEAPERIPPPSTILFMHSRRCSSETPQGGLGGGTLSMR